MNANDVIDAYVTDVALRLPRGQRGDVAFELRALIDEGLGDRAEAAGRPADAAMALAFVQAFGEPGTVAARYRPALTIIDPADGPGFLRAALVGVAVIWGLGLLESLQGPIASVDGLIRAFTQWWWGAVIPSLWWPGVLVAGYGAAAWLRRRRSPAARWTPRAADHLHGGRAAMALALAGIVLGIYVLIDPRWLLDVVWGGRAAASAYEALTYTDTFLGRQGPWLLALLLTNIPIFATVIALGRRPALLRRIEAALGLITSAVLAWAIADGPVFMTARSDAAAKALAALIVVCTLAGYAIVLYRRVRPTPDLRIRARG